MIKTTLGIEGMVCGMCEAHLNDAIRHAFTVRSAKASRRRGACVVISGDELDHDRVRQVVAEIGYELVSITSEPYRTRSFGLVRAGARRHQRIERRG